MNTHNRSLLRGWGGEQLPCSHQHVIFALLEFYYYYFFFGLSFGRQLPKPAGPINHLLSCKCVHIGGNNFSFNSNPFFFDEHVHGHGLVLSRLTSLHAEKNIFSRL